MYIDEFQKFLDESDLQLSRSERMLAKWGNKEVDVDKIDFDNPDSLKMAAGITDPEFRKSIDDLNSCLQDIFRIYLNSAAVERKKLADLLESKRHVLSYLVVFPSFAANQVSSTQDKLWVKTGATAALIEGGRTDFRDLWGSLGTLYCKAKSCGMDPDEIFIEIERVSKPDRDFYDSGKIGRGILSDFLKSEYLASLNC